MALKYQNQLLTKITTETTSAVSSENQIISQYPQTVLILLTVFLSLSIIADIFFVTCFIVYRRRKRQNALKGKEQNATTEEAVPLSSPRSSVRDILDDVRVRASLSLDKDLRDTSPECTEKLHSESNLNIKRTSIDHQGHVIYIPNSRTEDLRNENVQRQHPS